jgi:hypothetical protein
MSRLKDARDCLQSTREWASEPATECLIDAILHVIEHLEQDTIMACYSVSPHPRYPDQWVVTRNDVHMTGPILSRELAEELARLCEKAERNLHNS